jgi:hypothetical protein
MQCSAILNAVKQHSCPKFYFTGIRLGGMENNSSVLEHLNPKTSILLYQPELQPPWNTRWVGIDRAREAEGSRVGVAILLHLAIKLPLFGEPSVKVSNLREDVHIEPTADGVSHEVSFVPVSAVQFFGQVETTIRERTPSRAAPWCRCAEYTNHPVANPLIESHLA